MKRLTLVLAAVMGGSCLDFDARLESCRDGGVWVCGAFDAGPIDTRDAGADAGNPDAGTPDAGVLWPAVPPGDGGPVCNRGWCWDHPRTSGHTLKAVWGTSADDLWVGGDLGTLIHFDGTGWTSFEQDPRLHFESICGHDGVIYFAADTNGVGGLDRLLRFDGAWSAINDTGDDINQIACGNDGLWIARERGASRLAWGATTATALFDTQPGERCLGVAEVGPGQCVLACMGDGVGTPFVRMRQCDGGLEYEVVDDGGLGASFGVRDLWTDPHRGVLAGLTGIRAHVWQRDLGWAPAWSSSGGNNEDVYSGAPWANGSVAVGAGGVVDLTDAGATRRQVASSGNSYHFGVWAPPSGNAWMVGERGCILERDAGAWVPRSPCAVGFEDFAAVPRLFAITSSALYERSNSGWDLVRTLEPGQVALWENPDGGGFAHLSATRLRWNALLLPMTFSGATSMYVASENRVVVAQDNGLLVDTNFFDGGTRAFDAGVLILSLTGEPDGTVWAAGEQGVLFRSTNATNWTREIITGYTGRITDFQTAFGRQWAVAGGNEVATRTADGGSWAVHTFSPGVFHRVVPVDDQRALLLGDSEHALRITSSFAEMTLSPPPVEVKGRVIMQGDELWTLGWAGGGVLRFPVPP
ncbi:MAG: hypothetical protein Q8L48_00370 [Archangium sp.]|nr:hypothetical protein [Archangium sp.]